MPLQATNNTNSFFGEDLFAGDTDETDEMAAQSKLTTRTLEATYNKAAKTYTLPKEKFVEVLEELKKLRAEKTQWEKDKAELEGKVTELESKVKELESQAPKKRKSDKTSRKDEQKEDVNKAINDYVKDVLFRSHKFAPPGAKLKACCEHVWKGIKDKLKLDKGPAPLQQSDFEEIYESTVLAALSYRRQYVQSRCELAAKGKKFCVLFFWFCLFYAESILIYNSFFY